MQVWAKYLFLHKQMNFMIDIAALYLIFQQHPVVTTDSRDCPKGSIFFALKGESFDGNRFAAIALQAGCAYAVIDNPDYAVAGDERLILVDDCLRTLQRLANYHRRQLAIPVIGVTGTNGKTTTKELIAAVLSQKYNVLYTQGNFNNHIGVPKTLLRLTAQHQLAVIEMGANHPGEIDTLVHIAEPDCGIITNVGKAHLQGFGSFEGVVRTKGELYDFLRTRSGSCVFVHRDNPYLVGILGQLPSVGYGLTEEKHYLPEEVNGKVESCAPYLHFQWRMGQGDWHRVHTHLIGAYNLDNMLAAATIGLHFGVSEQQINEALSGYIPRNNRSQLTETEHNHLVVDAYNANPTSMMAALRNFRAMQVQHKFALLGDMRELGESSMEEHAKIVDYLQECDFEQVWLVGEEFAKIPHAYRSFAQVDDVIAALQKECPTGYFVLIKGSNSIRLSATVAYF